MDGVRLLTDPVVGDHIGPLARVAPPVAPGAIAGVDAVLLSHLHADHTDPPSLRQVGSPLVIAPRGAGQWLRKQVGSDVREIDEGGEQGVGPANVVAMPAAHDGRRWPLGLRAESLGFVVKGGAGAVYFAGDTDLFPAMAELAGSIDVALLPVSGWGPTLGPGHLDPDSAAEAVALIAPRVAIPIHWGTLSPMRPLPRHPDPGRPPHEFAELVAGRALDTEVRVLRPGERTVIG